MAKTMHTSIAQVTPESVMVRGHDLALELIGKISTSEYFYLLLTGRRPTAVQATLLDACIVAIAEHGFVPSVQVARMTLASAPESLQGAVSAGLLGCGSVILGSSETTGQALAAILAGADASGDLEAATVRVLQGIRDRGLPAPGFGHPIHRVEDPRASALLELARSLGSAGVHVAALEMMGELIPQVYGRTFALNASGAIPAVLMDVEFPLVAMKGIPLIGRTMSLVANLAEEVDSPTGFALADAAAASVVYNGVGFGTQGDA